MGEGHDVDGFGCHQSSRSRQRLRRRGLALSGKRLVETSLEFLFCCEKRVNAN
jgi:hypothetical protein